MDSKNNLLKTATIMIVFNLFSKLLGFLRDYMTAIKFGTSIQADAYLMASNIPNLLFVLLGVAISTIFIPIYNDIKHNNSIEELNDFTNNFITILLIISFILTIICEVLAPTLVSIMAPGFYGNTETLTILLTRILSSVIVFNTIIYIYTAILQCNNRFAIPASIGIPYNIVLIGYYIFFSDKYGVIGISIMVSIALIIQLAILYITLKRIGFKYKVYLNLKDKYIKKMIKLFIPVCIGTGMNQLNGIFNGIFASTLDSGSVAAMNYALKLNSLIVDILIVSFITVVYQNLSKVAAEKNYEKIADEANKSIVIIFLVLIPIVSCIFINVNMIVRILFERGAFNSNSTSMTASAFYYYLLGLFALAINEVLSRICYATGDTKTPMTNTFFSITVNIIFSSILVKKIGVGGIALGSTIGILFAASLLLYRIKRKIFGVLNRGTVVKLGKLFISAIPMIAILYLGKYLFLLNETLSLLQQVIRLCSISLSGIILYIISVYFIKIDEFYETINLFLHKMRRK